MAEQALTGLTLTDLTLAAARDRLVAGDIRAVDLTEACLTAIDAARPLNAFITVTADKARAMAVAADQRRARRRATDQAGSLEGIPLAVKDLFCTEGVRSTAGSRMLADFVPAYESHVTSRLWQAGAVMLGKTNLDEFAMGSSSVTSHFGPVHNPWQPGRNLVPGGSSGGSAAAVAARLAMGATGTDTGGSIRQPAALCGVVGVKPTWGRCSRRGIVAFASSLDQAGPLTRTVRDAAILLRVMAGHDPHDSTSATVAVPDFESALTGDVKGMRIGLPREYRMDGMPAAADRLWQQGAAWLKEAGATLVDVSLPLTRYALPCYYIVAPAEASSNLARYDGVRYGLRVAGADVHDMYRRTRAAGFGAEVRRRVLIGTHVLSAGYYDAYYLKAQRVRARIVADFRQAFGQCDLLLTPTTPNAAFPIGEKMDDPVAMYLNDIFTVPASMAGLPAISVPAGLTGDGLPLGLQLIAPAFDEASMFRAANLLEAAAGFDTRPR